MANLRTNNLSGEQGQNAYRGSVHFPQVHNSTDYLQIGSAGDFNFLHDGTSDWTAEFWVHPKQNNNRQTIFSTGGNSSSIGFACRIMEDGASGGSNGYKVLCQFSRGASGNYLGFLGGVIDNKGYSHVALVFTTSNKQLAIYINGQLTNSSDLDGTAEGTFGSGNFSSSNSTYAFTIGRENFSTTLYLHQTHLSNLRIVEGKTVYTATFTPPQSELTAIDGTVILACQDSTDPTQEATGKTVTANGQLASPDQFKILKHVPPFGVDAGNTFGGPIQQSSQGYMYFPTGGTVERGRGRAVIMGGTTHTPSPNSYMTRIDFLNIQTTGNSLKFGDLSFGSRDAAGAVSSTIRAVYAGGMGPSSEAATNSMDFVTIATQGNGTDYGDLTAAKRQGEGCSNGVRGLFMGGENDSPSSNTYNNVIDFCTIASIGNASDFGDLTAARDGGGVCSSPIRGVCGGGYDSGNSDVIDFVTIATTGNATDFGNLTAARTQATGCASATRGLFMGGRIAPNNKAEIDFITIASAGNASDFGDLSEGKNQASATASQTRGVHIGGNNGSSPYNGNTMEFVTIASTGNTTDFGDTNQSRTRASTSDSHGGLS